MASFSRPEQSGALALDRASAEAAGGALGSAPLRVAVVGVSTDSPCGVQDHATLLAQALEQQGVSCSLRWLPRQERSLAASRTELSAWTRGLSSELQASRPDVVLLHYSAFTLSYRGVPIFVRPTLAALRGLPLVTLLHEYAYPWGRNGLRGALWSISQRACLIDLVRASRALVLTADFRAAQLASRRWLPHRRMAVAPVFSNLPAPSPGSHGAPSQASCGPAPERQGKREQQVVGLFGYASEGTAQGLVLDALRLLSERGLALRLSLLGAPGADSSSGREWLAQAASRGIAGQLSFSGRLAAQDLSDALADCELLLFADPTGPTSRKTTLAASLASGSAVVAIDGPHRWRELSEAQAARLAPPRADALAEAVEQLLADGEQRAELGRRGRAFARQAMTAQASAEIVAALLREVLSAPVG